MDFSWTEEQITMREQAYRLGREIIAPNSREHDEKSELDMNAWKKAAEFGFQNMLIPAKYGGLDLDPLTVCYTMEGLGHGSRDVGFLTAIGAHIVICTVPIVLHGTEKQKEKYLPKLGSGEWIGGFAQTEPGSGSDAASIQTKAEKKGNKWILNGSKTFITNGPIGDLFLVMATIDRTLGHKGVTAFLVEKTFKGFKVGKELEKMGMRSSPTSELFFDDCEVPEENVLGEVGKGFKAAMSTVVWERACMLPGLIGCAEARLEDAVRYAKERVQFGQPIAEFQAIQEKMANMKTHLELYKLIFYKIAWLLKEGKPAAMEASLGKLFFSEMNRMDALDAFQIHGGYGYMKDYPIERDVRDCIANTIGAGTSEIQRMIIARELIKMY
ncbi:MAG: acyl-CoA dehydrogenase family protein [Spirochaetes bacterium]|nr:acyl-CoA dehydrogenase family protein [Spirochaetota bacterium]